MNATDRKEFAATIAEAKATMQVDVLLVGNLGSQVDQWNLWCDVYATRFGTRWYRVGWMILEWLLGDSNLVDQILTEPDSKLQFRFIGSRSKGQAKIKATAIGCEAFDGLG